MNADSTDDYFVSSIDLSPFTFPQEHSHVFIGSKTTSMRAIDLQTGQDVSSFTPPSGKVGSDTTPAAHRGSPEACDWNAEWGFRNKREDGRDAKGVDGECESDIDDRPEDKLFIGQTCEYRIRIVSTIGLQVLFQHTCSAFTPMRTASFNNFLILDWFPTLSIEI